MTKSHHSKLGRRWLRPAPNSGAAWLSATVACLLCVACGEHVHDLGALFDQPGVISWEGVGGREPLEPEDGVGGAPVEPEDGSLNESAASANPAALGEAEEPTEPPAQEAGSGMLAEGSSGPSAVPPAQFGGRWAMIGFEDPVGLEIVQRGTVLTGRGCASGVPLEGESELLCGDVTGSVAGDTAEFSFSFDEYSSYAAKTRISATRDRMTGLFTTAKDPDSAAFWRGPLTWLPVDDGETGLSSNPAQHIFLTGGYALTLVSAETDAAEYVPGRLYNLTYSWWDLIGDLGAFWHTEMTHPDEGSPIIVGPVPVTAPELPVSLELHFESDSVTEVRAVTGSGHTYTFAATRMVLP